MAGLADEWLYTLCRSCHEAGHDHAPDNNIELWNRLHDWRGGKNLASRACHRHPSTDRGSVRAMARPESAAGNCLIAAGRVRFNSRPPDRAVTSGIKTYPMLARSGARGARHGGRAGRGCVSALWRPFHLIGLALNVWRSYSPAALRGEATGSPTGTRGDVVATAKRNLRAGEVLDGEGGACVWGKLMPARASLEIGGLPIRPASRVPLQRDVQLGQCVTWDDVRIDTTDEAYRYRRDTERLSTDHLLLRVHTGLPADPALNETAALSPSPWPATKHAPAKARRRPGAGHPRLVMREQRKTWMAGPSPAMTTGPKPRFFVSPTELSVVTRQSQPGVAHTVCSPRWGLLRRLAARNDSLTLHERVQTPA